MWLKQEEKHGVKAAEATRVELYAQIPPIEKMDASLSTLTACEWVISDTNSIFLNKECTQNIYYFARQYNICILYNDRKLLWWM